MLLPEALIRSGLPAGPRRGATRRVPLLGSLPGHRHTLRGGPPAALRPGRPRQSWSRIVCSNQARPAAGRSAPSEAHTGPARERRCRSAVRARSFTRRNGRCATPHRPAMEPHGASRLHRAGRVRHGHVARARQTWGRLQHRRPLVASRPRFEQHGATSAPEHQPRRTPEPTGCPWRRRCRRARRRMTATPPIEAPRTSRFGVRASVSLVKPHTLAPDEVRAPRSDPR